MDTKKNGSNGSAKPYSYNNVDGYVHKVSELKNPLSAHRYFDFKVQRVDEQNRVVWFNPFKRDELKLRRRKSQLHW